MEKLEKQAIELLQMMCGSTGCVISDSGGKDSSVLKHITLKAHEIYGLPFSVRHNHTTVRACNAGSYRAGSMGDRGRHNNSGYYRTAGAYVPFQ